MKKLLLTVPAISLAFIILVFSVFQTSAIEYNFSDMSQTPVPYAFKIDYELPSENNITPASLLWPVKAGLDRIMLNLEKDPNGKTKLLLHYADERLVYSQELLEEGKVDMSLTALTKAEKYLEEAFSKQMEAYNQNIGDNELLREISRSSLKHREVIDYLVTISPEKARPFVVKTSDCAKRIYSDTVTQLYAQGLTPIH